MVMERTTAIFFTLLISVYNGGWCTQGETRDKVRQCSQEESDPSCVVYDGDEVTPSSEATGPPGEKYLFGDRCPQVSHDDISSSDNPTWQPVGNREVMIFSAYVERRILADGPAIRLIASGLQAEYVNVGELYCLLWDVHSQDHGPRSVKAKYKRIYPSTMHHDMWVSHFILCPLQDLDHIPDNVSITAEPCEKDPGNSLPIQNKEKRLKNKTHGVCLPPVYNQFSDWGMMIEFLEQYRLLGAVHIVMYEQAMDPAVKEVVNFYESNSSDEFTVEVIPWNYPPGLKRNVNCQRASLNDCYYRIGSRHQFLHIHDLDEIQVPRVTGTWSELMREIYDPRYGAYLFQHSYFRRNRTGEEPYLITQQSLWTTNEVAPPGKIRCKTMYNSDLAISIDLHFPFELLPGAKEYMVLPSEGILHHYRSSPMESFVKYPERYTFIEDRYMERYKKDILKAYNSVKF